MMKKNLSKAIFTMVFLMANLLTIANVSSADLSDIGNSEYLRFNKDVLFQDFTGKSHKIDEYIGNGKWLVVMIWASNCHVCNTEVKSYMAFHEQYKDKNATVLGLSVDGWEHKDKALNFIKKHKVNFPNVLASPLVADHFYELETGKNLVGTPSFLVYGPTGELKAEQSGAVPVALIENFIKESSKK